MFSVSALWSSASDWPEYRGPHGDGICTETPNLNWPANGPKVLWKEPIKNGFSSFTVADGKAFTQMNRDIEGANREVCVALRRAGVAGRAKPIGDIDDAIVNLDIVKSVYKARP